MIAENHVKIRLPLLVDRMTLKGNSIGQSMSGL